MLYNHASIYGKEGRKRINVFLKFKKGGTNEK